GFAPEKTPGRNSVQQHHGFPGPFIDVTDEPIPKFEDVLALLKSAPRRLAAVIPLRLNWTVWRKAPPLPSPLLLRRRGRCRCFGGSGARDTFDRGVLCPLPIELKHGDIEDQAR